MSRLLGSRSGTRQVVHQYALPDGWTMSAKGLWHHESGACVEHTGRGTDYRYLAQDADGVRAYAPSRAEAFAWASGEVT